MSLSQWNREPCPVCQSVNWFEQPHELQLFGIDSYTCWKCKNMIRMMGGELGDEYQPHVEGTQAIDEECGEGHTEGMERPT